jgi:prolyl-tRNA editing enzyme YbaK/EbsC (Cys-tRNA(Pro) deacylase)
MDCEWIIVGGGGRDLKVKMDPQVLLELGGESVIDLAKALA